MDESLGYHRRRCGPRETELFRPKSSARNGAKARMLALVPMGTFARPHDIAGAIAILMSEEAGYTTEQTLFADGEASVGRASA